MLVGMRAYECHRLSILLVVDGLKDTLSNRSKPMKKIQLLVVFSMFAIGAAQAAPDVKTDLKENPDKIAAYNNYMRATMTEIRGLTAKNPDVAEKRIAEMEALLKRLKPTTQQAKTLQQRALRSAGFLKQNLELERTPLADFAKRLALARQVSRRIIAAERLETYGTPPA